MLCRRVSSLPLNLLYLEIILFEVSRLRYLGSKTLLVEQIYALVGPQPDGSIFCDPFGGIGTVGRYMKQQGFQVLSGDLLQFAHYFQKALIQLDAPPPFPNLTSESDGDVEHYLNRIVTSHGWFIEEYCKKRVFFTIDNAKRIQACINAIWHWRTNYCIDEDEYAFLVASLIQSMDRVANTAGTYYAYLKHYHRKALQPFRFQFLRPIQGKHRCQCFLEDANTLVKQHECQILYLDPPYNTRDYAKYYHLPETIARGEIPKPSGKSGVPIRHDARSPYIRRSKIKEAFLDLLTSSHSQIILFHYTDNGLLCEQFIRDALSKLGTLEEYYFDCKGYRTSCVHTSNSRHHVYKVIL